MAVVFPGVNSSMMRSCLNAQLENPEHELKSVTAFFQLNLKFISRALQEGNDLENAFKRHMPKDTDISSVKPSALLCSLFNADNSRFYELYRERLAVNDDQGLFAVDQKDISGLLIDNINYFGGEDCHGFDVIKTRLLSDNEPLVFFFFLCLCFCFCFCF
jgi:hypothetical protein